MPDSRPDVAGAARYDTPTILFHWVTAVLVLTQFVLGETWGWPEKPVHHLMVVAHLTAGMMMTVLVPLRIVWRVTKGRHLSGLLIAPPFARFPTETLAWIQRLHDWNAWLIIGIATGHAGAALFHQFLLKDRVLERMSARASSPF